MFQKWENINKICFHQQTSTFGRSHHIWCTFLHVCARVRMVVCQSLTDYDSSERTRFYFHFDRDTICFQCYCCNISRCENNDVELLLPHLCNSVSRAQIEIREAYIETIVWILCVCVRWDSQSHCPLKRCYDISIFMCHFAIVSLNVFVFNGSFYVYYAWLKSNVYAVECLTYIREAENRAIGIWLLPFSAITFVLPKQQIIILSLFFLVVNRRKWARKRNKFLCQFFFAVSFGFSLCIVGLCVCVRVREIMYSTLNISFAIGIYGSVHDSNMTKEWNCQIRPIGCGLEL